MPGPEPAPPWGTGRGGRPGAGTGSPLGAGRGAERGFGPSGEPLRAGALAEVRPAGSGRQAAESWLPLVEGCGERVF